MKRTARLASLTLVGALAFTACGNDSDDTDATSGDPVESTSETTDGAEEPTDEEPSEASSAPAEGEEVDVEALLDDMAAGLEGMTTAHTTMTMSLMGQQINGEGDSSYEGDESRARLSMTVPGAGEMDIVMIGSILYMRMGELTQGKFIKTDISDPDGPLGDMSSMVSSVDPAQQFQAYRDGYTKAVYQGEEELQGETMRKYVLTLDLTKVDQFKDVARQGGLKNIPVQMWLDEDHVMRKMHLEMDVEGQKTVTEVEISDLGKPVSITAPPASQVIDGGPMAG